MSQLGGSLRRDVRIDRTIGADRRGRDAVQQRLARTSVFARSGRPVRLLGAVLDPRAVERARALLVRDPRGIRRPDW